LCWFPAIARCSMVQISIHLVLDSEHEHQSRASLGVCLPAHESWVQDDDKPRGRRQILRDAAWAHEMRAEDFEPCQRTGGLRFSAGKNCICGSRKSGHRCGHDAMLAGGCDPGPFWRSRGRVWWQGVGAAGILRSANALAGIKKLVLVFEIGRGGWRELARGKNAVPNAIAAISSSRSDVTSGSRAAFEAGGLSVDSADVSYEIRRSPPPLPQRFGARHRASPDKGRRAVSSCSRRLRHSKSWIYGRGRRNSQIGGVTA